MAGRGPHTQGTAEPTHESAIPMQRSDPPTQEARTQDSVEPAAGALPNEAATPSHASGRHGIKEKTTEGSVADNTQVFESSARAPDPASMRTGELQDDAETKPAKTAVQHSRKENAATIAAKTAPTLQSTPEKKKERKGGKKAEDDSTQRVGVLKPAVARVSASKGAESVAAKTEEKEKEVEEKRANCTSLAAKREKHAPTAASGGQTVTAGALNTGTRRRTNKPTESDRGGTTQTIQGSESKKPTSLERSGKTTDTMDYYQRRRKQQLEKCKLMLVRNKQLVEIVSHRDMHDRSIEDEQVFHGYLWRGDLSRLIKEEGQFLVRKLDYNGAEAYVISVMAQSEVVNVLIKQTNSKKLFWVMNYAFRTVVELIDYHYRNNEPVDEASVYLRIPVFRQDWQYSHEQIETAKQLGSGNFGTVHAGYLKRHPFDPPVKVAVKTLTLGEDENMTASDKNEFLREANLMLAVDHPNLVKLFGLAATRMPIQIVMELCDETLLGKLKVHHHAWSFDVKDGLMSVAEKGRYVLDAARGLEYLHSCFIIHRDIAARNVLIRDGQAKISDFGLSIVGGMKKTKMTNLPTRWCAPETLAQGTYSMHTDVFSFGALIYEVFSFGRQPYTDVEATTIRGGLRNFIVYGGQIGCKLNPIDPDTPVWIKEMIDRCRQRDCYARPLFPEIVKKLENQLGSKASLVSLAVSIRERFQKFIVDMISIADYAQKEEEHIKADMDWLHLHSSFESLEDIDQQEALRRHCPYLPYNKQMFNKMELADATDRVRGGEADAEAAPEATIPEVPQKKK